MKNNWQIERISTFSDGVFAIAATLLILEIKVPHVAEHLNDPMALWAALKSIWPSFLAFALSFGTIFTMWVNYHKALQMVEHSSPRFLFANGFLLLTITFIPYPTAVLAEYINTPQINIAVMAYCGSSVLVNLGFNLWWQSMLRPKCLLNSSISVAAQNKISMQTFGGFVIYLIITILAYWIPVVSIIIIVSLFFLWVTLAISDRHYDEE